MSDDVVTVTQIPRRWRAIPLRPTRRWRADVAIRVADRAFNAIATGVLVLAILHTFAAARFAAFVFRVLWPRPTAQFTVLTAIVNGRCGERHRPGRRLEN